MNTKKSLLSTLTVGAMALALLMPGAAGAQDGLPARLANDPVVKALGAKVVAAAIKEGTVSWYGGSTSEDFFKGGARERFEKRFGIKVDLVSGRLRSMTDRIRTEGAVGRQVADVFEANDQYMLELYGQKRLEKWKPPAPEIAKFKHEVFVNEPEGWWWPVHVSAQAIIINTDMVKPGDEPKSYWDIVNPRWKGKVGIRDPRSSGGGAWHMMGIYNQSGLGIDYIKKLKATVAPFIISGGSRRVRDAVARGQFAIAFSGRGEFIHDLPKGTPVKFIVPKEGQAWTPSSLALIKGSPHPNAARVAVTWFYEVDQLQDWNKLGRPVPHPDMKAPIPEMSLARYPLMKAIPSKWLGAPDFFFKEMEQVFGIR